MLILIRVLATRNLGSVVGEVEDFKGEDVRIKDRVEGRWVVSRRRDYSDVVIWCLFWVDFIVKL